MAKPSTADAPEALPSLEAADEAGQRSPASSAGAPSSHGMFATPTHAERFTVASHTSLSVTTPSPTAATAAHEQIAVQIAHAVHEGNDRLVVQLRPQSLGRIRIELEVAPDNRVIAVIGVERQETLDLLQRDARGLERALNDAGLKADAGSLSFNLRGEGEHRGYGLSGGSARSTQFAEVDAIPNPAPPPYRVYTLSPADGVDIRV
jgi:flagellar hook-length control protein FliK